MMRRILWIGCALLLISSFLAGAGGQREPEATTISYWKGPHTSDFGVQTETAVWTDLIAQFEVSNPGTRVEYLVIPWAEFQEKVTAGFASRRPPDVVYVPGEWTIGFALDGQLLALDDQVPELLSELKAVHSPDLWKTGVFGGKRIGIPWLTDGFFLFYNKKLFRDAGLAATTPPKTWDELVAYARKMTRDTAGDGKTDQWGYAAPATSFYTDPYWFWSFLWQAGADILNEDWSANAFNNAEGVLALQFYADLFLKHKVSPPAGTFNRMQQVEMFFEGKIAMFQEEQMFSARALADNPNVEFAVDRLPAGPAGSYGWSNVGHHVVYKNTPSLQPVLEWVKYVNQPDVLSAYYRHTDFWPSRTDVSVPRANPYLDQMDRLRTGYFKLWPLHPRLAEINQRFWEEAEPALRGDKTPREGIEDAARAVDEIVTKAGVGPGGKK